MIRTKEGIKVGDIVYQKGCRDSYRHPIKVNEIKHWCQPSATNPPKTVRYTTVSEDGKRCYHIQTVSKQIPDCWELRA